MMSIEVFFIAVLILLLFAVFDLSVVVALEKPQKAQGTCQGNGRTKNL